MKRVPIVTCFLLAAALMVLPASAGAKSPPKGKYDCVIGSTYFGSITIKSTKSYRRSGKSGTYWASSKRTSFSDGRRGYRLTFKTGPFKKYKGRWYKSTTSDIYEIALKNPIDGFESIYCDK